MCAIDFSLVYISWCCSNDKQLNCVMQLFKVSTFLSPMLAELSPVAGSSLISFGSTGRGLLISVSEGPLWGGTGKSSGWERSANDSRPSCFTVVLPLLSSTMQSSCSSEAPSNTLLSSVRGHMNPVTQYNHLKTLFLLVFISTMTCVQNKH